MMAVVDRSDPEMQAAIDQAARVAEWMLDHSNADAEKELALDIILAYVEGVHPYIRPATRLRPGHATGMKRLAWALTLLERTPALRQHEQRLLDDAWDQVAEDALQREWEAMGQ